MKNMCNKINIGRCPNCNNGQFVVFKSSQDIFLTNTDGEIVDARGEHDRCMGRCCMCGWEFDMIETHTGFIPATRLRKILFNVSPHYVKDEKHIALPNPFERS